MTQQVKYSKVFSMNKDLKPKVTDNRYPGGSCDNCGKALGKRIWILVESTGCSSKCAQADFDLDVDLTKEYLEWEEAGCDGL